VFVREVMTLPCASHVCAIARLPPLIPPHPLHACDPSALGAALEVRGGLAAAALPQGHLHRRFLRGPRSLVGKDAVGLSASTIGRLKDVWQDEHAQWQERDLSAKRLRLRLGRWHLPGARLGDEKQCILVLIRATPEGKKELVGFTDGARESAHDWRNLLLQPKRRGLQVSPELAIADGGLAAWRDLAENARATLLGAQDRQRTRQAAEEPASESQARLTGDLDGGDKIAAEAAFDAFIES
jgi:putative transposase